MREGAGGTLRAQAQGAHVRHALLREWKLAVYDNLDPAVDQQARDVVLQAAAHKCATAAPSACVLN